MIRLRILPQALFLFLLSGAALFIIADQVQLSEQEKHGKHIYTKTESPSGKEIKAYIGIASTEAPGSIMACANCHGPDGIGRKEAGIDPGIITWSELSKPYGVRHASGRQHPPYDDKSLARAISSGIDPAGNKLDPAMPHYSMPEEDMAALIAYLKRLGSEMDPGLSNSLIRIGTIIPSEGPSADLGAAIEATLRAFFAEVNERGGIYGRKFELVSSRGSTVSAGQVSSFISNRDIFALVSTFAPEIDAEMPVIVEERSIPLIGPFTLFPATELALNRYVFYILAGLREQSWALLDYAAEKGVAGKSHLAVLFPARADLKEVTTTVKERADEKRWARVSLLDYPPGQFNAEDWMRRLRSDKVDFLLFLGAGAEGKALLQQAEKTGWSPALLLPGPILGDSVNAIPQQFRNQTFIAYPSIPDDRKEQAVRDFQELVRKHKLPTRHPGAQLSAYAAAEILLEGLRRSGRDVSREKLIATLEKMYEFETGLTPPISYDPNRHIGALGAYIVAMEAGKENARPVARWVAVR